VQPNGIACSPDEQLLYVVYTGRSHKPDGPAHIRCFSVGGAGKLKSEGVFADCTVGTFGGLRVDIEGRVWTSAGDGVHCYHPDGTLLGKILVPEVVGNACFGGAKRNHLFICGTTSLYGVRLRVNGAKTF
jgi:gluconolactonase